MPTEYTILHPEPVPLGSLTSVKQLIAGAFPAVQFYRDPSGAEKLAALADANLPSILREHFLRAGATIQGDFFLEGVSVRFFLAADDAPIVDEVGVEVRGTIDRARPFLETLVARTGWVVIRERCDVIIGACSPTRLADRSHAMVFPPPSSEEAAAAHVDADRQFYDQLGPERHGVACRAPDCTRGAVVLSIFCRVHHFESVHHRSCPFSD